MPCRRHSRLSSGFRAASSDAPGATPTPAPQPRTNAHHRLAGKRLIALDVAAVVAGSTYRGEFEERLQSLLHDCEAAQGSIVLFCDEIHTLGKCFFGVWVCVGTRQLTVGLTGLVHPATTPSRLACNQAANLPAISFLQQSAPATYTAAWILQTC